VTTLRAGVVAACVVASMLSGVRWLRVAQREHYLPGAVTRFAWRWWTLGPLNVVGLVAAWLGAILAGRWPGSALATAVIVAVGPLGLGLRGRTSPLAWTRRAKTLAAAGVVLDAVAEVIAVVAGVGPLVAAATAFAVPIILDIACSIVGPFEAFGARRFVRQAADRLRRVGPTVVAITGSYGKTSTKGYVAHLLAGSKTVVASPASFNNRAGLARAVNENLTDASDVFVAEMGTYGRGEIAALCSWMVPDIAVITAIGPVHLERFGTEEAIVEAKAEILVAPATVVLNVDDERLAELARRSADAGKRVWRVSERDVEADVCVRVDGDVLVAGVTVGRAPPGARPGNVACAVAVALALGVESDEIGRRVGSLPTAPHRLEPGTGVGGFVVLDDTYNANPAGARVALDTLVALAPEGGRRVVVTPGMVELGPAQRQENRSFARSVAEVATDLVVVGRTNRRALMAGAGPGDGRPGLEPVMVRGRAEAVAWVRDHLGVGDIVLYENDLPDQYP
jgi:UDP-N-acetylmuramoyl-tripeptide--D-alanyl-D-alanine ligase